MEKFPIETAPGGDGWILAFVPGRADEKLGYLAWTVATRGDGGWMDEDGYPVDPTHWVPLPDPQPTPTGWRPAEGKIVIAQCRCEGLPSVGFAASVVKPDGEYDRARDPALFNTLDDAREGALVWQRLIGLEIEEDLRPIPLNGTHQ